VIHRTTGHILNLLKETYLILAKAAQITTSFYAIFIILKAAVNRYLLSLPISVLGGLKCKM